MSSIVQAEKAKLNARLEASGMRPKNADNPRNPFSDAYGHAEIADFQIADYDKGGVVGLHAMGRLT